MNIRSKHIGAYIFVSRIAWEAGNAGLHSEVSICCFFLFSISFDMHVSGVNILLQLSSGVDSLARWV